MDQATGSEVWVDRAFRLGYFLHGERDTAVQITARAMNKVRLAATSQGKRLYYRLTGRADARKSRSKVSVSEPHLLQRLIYVESEAFEREKEAASRTSDPHSPARPARTSDLIVFFVKHLVRITTKRNSFYVTLGLIRLLYNYTTPETMDLYNLVIQDPDRVHDDYYYRSRKGVLLKELKERFGELLEVVKGSRGEQRWRAADSDDKHRELVQECLHWFTPWSTPCVVPERFDPFTDTIEKLNFAGRHPDEEHEVEVNRIHATVHPECFARLAAANRLPLPGERLELPHFAIVDENSAPPRTPTSISADELQTIGNLLAQEASRRKAASSGIFRVLVDGQERGEINLQRQGSAQFAVGEEAEVVEVYGSDNRGPLLLANHLLNLAGADNQKTTITLERGQKISFAINLVRNSEGSITGAIVTVGYQETSILHTAVAAFGRARAALVSVSSSMGWWKPVATLATLGLLVAGIWWLWSTTHKTPNREFITIGPTPVPTAVPVITPQPEQTPGPQPEHKQPGRSIAPLTAPQFAVNRHRQESNEAFVERSLVPDANPNSQPHNNGLRAWDPIVMGKPLNEIHSFFVETASGDTGSQALVKELQKRLAANGNIIFANREQADAALKISARPASSQPDEKRLIVIVRGVNAAGYVVWPASRHGSSYRYVGQPQYVAERVVADVASAINRSKSER